MSNTSSLELLSGQRRLHVIPAEAGIHDTLKSGCGDLAWMPAYAGMTSGGGGLGRWIDQENIGRRFVEQLDGIEGAETMVQTRSRRGR